jgi:hypothetical protein
MGGRSGPDHSCLPSFGEKLLAKVRVSNSEKGTAAFFELTAGGGNLD